MSRPEIPIDWKKVDELLVSGCPGTEVAAYFSMHPNTFYDRVVKKFDISFTEYLQQNRSKGDALLRAHQYAKALGLTEKGDNTLLIWLGKNRLSQRDKEEKSDIAPNDKHLTELIQELKISNSRIENPVEGEIYDDFERETDIELPECE